MIQYHPYAEEIFVDPYPIYRRMRAEQPACYVEEYDAWFLSRFEDIWRVGPDFQHFSALQGTTPNTCSPRTPRSTSPSRAWIRRSTRSTTRR